MVAGVVGEHGPGDPAGEEGHLHHLVGAHLLVRWLPHIPDSCAVVYFSGIFSFVLQL